MTKTFITFCFLICCLNSNAQNSNLLIGKWVFKKALNKEVDAEGRKMLNSEIINKMTFDFQNNGDFVGYAMGENMRGKWAVGEKPKRMILTEGKQKYEFFILKLTESDLILKVGLGEFLMKKI